MRRYAFSWKLFLGCVVFLFLGVAIATGEHALSQSSSNQAHHVTRKPRFDCLPKDVRLDEVVAAGKRGNVTVEKTLIGMKAQCRNRKLVDAKRREIKFFRPSCWGNPPADYLGIQQRENAELQKLKAKNAVIVFTCNPLIQ